MTMERVELISNKSCLQILPDSCLFEFLKTLISWNDQINPGKMSITTEGCFHLSPNRSRPVFSCHGEFLVWLFTSSTNTIKMCLFFIDTATYTSRKVTKQSFICNNERFTKMTARPDISLSLKNSFISYEHISSCDPAFARVDMKRTPLWHVVISAIL